MTGAGMLVGTPGYVSPEQIMGQELDGRADQYGLAVTAYEMLVGRNPFSGIPLSAILVHQTTKGAPPPHEACPSIPAPVSLAIVCGMSIDPVLVLRVAASFHAPYFRRPNPMRSIRRPRPRERSCNRLRRLRYFTRGPLPDQA